MSAECRQHVPGRRWTSGDADGPGETSFDLAAQRAEGVPKVRKLEPVE